MVINYKILLLIVISWCSGVSSVAAIHTKPGIQPLDGSSVPDNIIFFDDKDNKYSLDQFEGKTILLVFWATWCASCIQEISDLDILQKDFRKLPFTIIPVSQDFQGIQIVQEHFKNYQIRYLPIFYDHKNQLFKAFDIIGLPTSILIDPDGKKLISFVGNTNWYDENVRATILSHIPGNYPEPKNSQLAPSMSWPIPPSKSEENVETKQPEEEQEKSHDTPVQEPDDTKNKL